MRKLGIFYIGITSMLMLAAIAIFWLGSLTYTVDVTDSFNHVVRSGETVWDIADKYMPEQKHTQDVREFIYYIKKANGWEYVPVIHAGQKIIIPLSWQESLK